MFQLSDTLAPSAGIKALIKIIANGIITNNNETIANGISKTQLLPLVLSPSTR
jgi:hypothetical protein